MTRPGPGLEHRDGPCSTTQPLGLLVVLVVHTQAKDSG